MTPEEQKIKNQRFNDLLMETIFPRWYMSVDEVPKPESEKPMSEQRVERVATHEEIIQTLSAQVTALIEENENLRKSLDMMGVQYEELRDAIYKVWSDS